jgi:diguanylate cyclase (GGDEF)-like protein
MLLLQIEFSGVLTHGLLAARRPGACGLQPLTCETAMEEHLTESEGLDLVGVLSAVEETAYTWDIASDRIEWESNMKEVLGLNALADVATGAGFQSLIAPEHLARRHDAIFGAKPPEGSRGVPYRAQYKFLPGGLRSSSSMWLEDTGRWWPGADGKPARARGVIRVISDRHWEEQRLLHGGDHDELTGQLNRIRLTEALGAVLGRAERTRQSCAFLIAAVNNLAVINSSFGFDVGNEVVAATARVMKEKLRGGDALGRYSSNKFGIILNDCGAGALRIAAERFMKAVRGAKIKTTACQLCATVSIGGVIIPEGAKTVPQALSHALQALDRAKQKHFDCFMAYEPNGAHETARQRNVAIAGNVISALDDDRMRFLLQPLISAETGKPALFECLLRIVRPDGSIVSAEEFITSAEQLGLSHLIDRRTLELAVALLKKHAGLRLTLNVSSLTTADKDWIACLHQLTEGARELTERLTIEITETAAIHDLDQAIAFVNALRAIGCRVAIDDFGAGFTSFKNLKLLKVDMLKIDGSFVKDLGNDPSGRVFIKTMIEIAETFNMETVAEWVGDEATAKFLREAGITYLQGFHYGMPLSVDEFEATLTA